MEENIKHCENHIIACANCPYYKDDCTCYFEKKLTDKIYKYQVFNLVDKPYVHVEEISVRETPNNYILHNNKRISKREMNKLLDNDIYYSQNNDNAEKTIYLAMVIEHWNKRVEATKQQLLHDFKILKNLQGE